MKKPNFLGMWLKKLGQHRGRMRLWFDCQRVRKAGLEPGVRFNLTPMANGLGLKLSPHPEGTHKVSSKVKGERTVPVIDVNDDDLLAPLSQEPVLRVVILADGLYLLPLASEVAKRERIKRLQDRLKSGEPLRVASLAHGGGVLSNAAHHGLQAAGLKVETAFCNEIDEGYLDQSLAVNEAITEQTIPLCVPMQELIQDSWAMAQLGQAEILEGGIPCSGASVAGRAKRGLSLPESHPEVGHLIYAAIALIQKLQPAAIVLENVTTYASSGSAEILRSQLRDMGYNISEHVLSARDYGALENRIRWAFVATTDGIDPLDVLPQAQAMASRKLGDLLDPVPADDKSWSELQYLKDKEVRDVAAGKGFAMQTVDAESTSVPVIRKHYSKGGSTDPFVKHPTNPKLLRKFTPGEHARIKGVPEHLIGGLSATTAHQLLGQGIAYVPFKELFEALGRQLKAVEESGPKWSASNGAAARLEAVVG